MSCHRHPDCWRRRLHAHSVWVRRDLWNKWYDIKIEVNGESYKCYLDGKLYHEYSDVLNFDPVYAHAGETDDEVIIKLVNVSEKPLPVAINLKNAGKLDTKAEVIVISGNPDDENSYENPKLIAPVEESLSGISNNFTYTTKASSVSVIKIKKNWFSRQNQE